MSEGRRSRVRAVSLFVAIVACIGATFSACTEYHAAGEGCIKDDDCLSGVCLAQVCSQPAPVLSGSAYPDDGGSEDAGTDSGSTTSAKDSGKSSDSSSDAPADGPAASQDSGHPPVDSGLGPDTSDGASDLDGASDDARDALNVASLFSQLA